MNRSVSGSEIGARGSSLEKKTGAKRRATLSIATNNNRGVAPSVTRSRTSPPSRYPSLLQNSSLNSKGASNNNNSNSNSNSNNRFSDANGSNIQVYVRCRSRNQREIDEKSSVVISTMGLNGKEVIFSTSSSPISSPKKTYTFDQVFGAESDQQLVFDVSAKNYIKEMLQGYNCTIFAYGQTGTGKTYTMSGDINILGDMDSKDKILLGEHAGIIPRVLVDLFKDLDRETNEYSVKISFLELYNERLKDLLSQDSNDDESIRIFDNNNFINNYNNTNNKQNTSRKSSINSKNKNKTEAKNNIINNVRNRMPNKLQNSSNEDNQKSRHGNGSGNTQSSILVKGMDEIYIKSAFEGLELLTEGSLKRKVAATKCNDLSSRSHTIFTITTNITKVDPVSGEKYVTIGKLNLVDLAGSENINRSGAENKRAQEAGVINKSLLTLGRVINALVDNSQHIPYRESKLTRLLQDSLGGRTKTCIIATVSPAKISMEETISTLEYATRAKSIKNTPQVNQSLTKDVSLNSYVGEIERLRHELKASRKKEGIYITQDQYALYESNVILIDEQKTQIHNMDDQLKRFKDQYVEQTKINKELEGKYQKLEIKNERLLLDKDILIKIIDEYSSNCDKFIEKIKDIHTNNINLTEQLESERNNISQKFNNSIENQTILIKNVLDQSNELAKYQEMLKEYNTGFEKVLTGVNEELEKKTVNSQSLLNSFVSNIKFDNIINEVQTVQKTIENQLKQLEIPATKELDNIYDKHREIMSTCLTTVLQSVQNVKDKFEEGFQTLLNHLSEERTATNEIISTSFSNSSSHIDEYIKYIQLLEKELERERNTSIDTQSYIKTLQSQIELNIHKQRADLCDTLLQSIKDSALKHFELDAQMLSKSTEVFNEYEKNTRMITRSNFNDMTIRSIECLEEIQQNADNDKVSLTKRLDDNHVRISNIINGIDVPLAITLAISKLHDCCNEDSSKRIASVINKLDEGLAKNVDSITSKIRNSISLLTGITKSTISENLSNVKGLSLELKSLCDYILQVHKGNISQISKTQSDIFNDYFTGLEDVLITLKALLKDQEILSRNKPAVNIEDNIIRKIPKLDPPNNITALKDIRPEKVILDKEDNARPLANISPARHGEADLKYIPSTPVPVPDQPLPKVLVPKSINSTVKRSHKISPITKLSVEPEPNRGNNLKRRFTIEGSEIDSIGVSNEGNNKKIHF